MTATPARVAAPRSTPRSAARTIAGRIGAGLYLATAAFQVALAAGAPWGRAAYGGFAEQPGVELRVSSAIAAVVWTGAALVILRRSGHGTWAPLPEKALPATVWVLFGLSIVSVGMNAITPSDLERAIWVPVTLGMAASTLTVALTSRGVSTK